MSFILGCKQVQHENFKHLFCLFDLILYVPVINFSVMWGRVFLGWTSTKQKYMYLAKGHNKVTPVRLEPMAPRSGVKHSTTEPLLWSIRYKHEKLSNGARCLHFDLNLIYIPTLQAVKALKRLCICAVSSEPSLLAFAIHVSTKIL